MATGLLKQLQWGSGARAHKNIEAFKYKDVPFAYVVLLFHVQGMDHKKGLSKTNKNY